MNRQHLSGLLAGLAGRRHSKMASTIRSRARTMSTVPLDSRSRRNRLLRNTHLSQSIQRPTSGRLRSSYLGSRRPSASFVPSSLMLQYLLLAPVTSTLKPTSRITKQDSSSTLSKQVCRPRPGSCTISHHQRQTVEHQTRLTATRMTGVLHTSITDA